MGKNDFKTFVDHSSYFCQCKTDYFENVEANAVRIVSYYTMFVLSRVYM